MKLDINEVHLVKNAIESISIKATDARAVADILDKFDNEFIKLQKIDSQK